MTGDDLAAAALSLEGVPFRLHGRDPSRALDCVGLLEAALDRCGIRARLPNGYALRARRIDDPASLLESIGLIPARDAVSRGDVLILRLHPLQHHVAIATAADRVVHAHAGLRRVVHSRLPADWPLAGHWRAPFQQR